MLTCSKLQEKLAPLGYVKINLITYERNRTQPLTF